MRWGMACHREWFNFLRNTVLISSFFLWNHKSSSTVFCTWDVYLDPVELMLVLLLALRESPRLMTFRPAIEKFLSLGSWGKEIWNYETGLSELLLSYAESFKYFQIFFRESKACMSSMQRNFSFHHYLKPKTKVLISIAWRLFPVKLRAAVWV